MNAGGPYQSAGVGEVTTTSASITGLQPGVAVKYHVVVFAKNAGGLSPKSAEVSATTLKTMQ